MSRATNNPAYKIFEAVVEEKTHWEKKKLLEENGIKPFQQLCRLIADPKVKWMLPPGTPNYRPLQDDGSDLFLYPRVRNLYLFINDERSKNVTPERRMKLFVDLLENIHPEDAKWIIRIKDGDIPKGITPHLLQRAFPDLLNVPL